MGCDPFWLILHLSIPGSLDMIKKKSRAHLYDFVSNFLQLLLGGCLRVCFEIYKLISKICREFIIFFYKISTNLKRLPFVENLFKDPIYF